MIPREYDPEFEDMQRQVNGLRDKILILVIAALAGSGGSMAYRQISDPAPDRFTGSQAHAMERGIMARMENHEARIGVLETSQKRLLDGMDAIEAGVHRIEVEIARLPPDEWRERIRQLENKLKDPVP